MADPISESDLELLYEKHGHEPLVHLIRKLIVAIDQTELGSIEREKTVQLLKHITKQVNIAPSSSDWLDWLETLDEDDFDWDQLKSHSTNHRKTIEIDDIEPKQDRPKLEPMTKEQIIWAKALDRQNNKGGLKKVYFIVILLLLLIGLVFLGIKYSPKVDFSFLENFNKKKSKQVDLITSPIDLWGNFQSDLFKANELIITNGKIKTSFLESIELNKLPIEIREWINQKKNKNQFNKGDVPSVYWLGLRELEHRFFGTINAPNNPLSWNQLKPGFRRWDFVREREHQIQYKGSFIENFTQTASGWDLQVKRIIHQNGVAHRVLIDQKGLLAWSYRIKWGEALIEGKMVRLAEGGFKVTSSKSWKDVIEFDIQGTNLNLAPALWSPSLRTLNYDALIFPITGELCKGSIFWEDTQVYPNSDGFQLKPNHENWIETWVKVQ